MDKIEDYIALGQADSVWRNFLIEYRAALGNPNHELRGFISSVTQDGLPSDTRVAFQILVSASQNPAHGFHKTAQKYIPEETGGSLARAYSLMKKMELNELIIRGEPIEILCIASLIAEDHRRRTSAENKKRSQRPRPNSQRKMRALVIQDMAIKRQKQSEITFSIWFDGALANGHVNEFEIHRKGTKCEISHSTDGTIEIVEKSTMMNSWWPEAGKINKNTLKG